MITKLIHREFEEAYDDTNSNDLMPYAICPYCGERITPTDGCEHVILLFSTVNFLAEDYDSKFIEDVLKCTETNPDKYFENYAEVLDCYYDDLEEDADYLELFRNTDKADLIADAADYICPEILEVLSNAGLLNTQFKEIYEFAYYDAYAGGGTYMYIAKEE